MPEKKGLFLRKLVETFLPKRIVGRIENITVKHIAVLGECVKINAQGSFGTQGKVPRIIHISAKQMTAIEIVRKFKARFHLRAIRASTPNKNKSAQIDALFE
jgi:hypothetical protein